MRNKRTIIKEKGITLVALVVTIIVLLILAGITIQMVLGQNGIIGKVADSKQVHVEAQIKEEIRLAWNAVQTEGIPKQWTLERKTGEFQKELKKMDSSATAELSETDENTIKVFYKDYRTTINIVDGELASTEQEENLSETGTPILEGEELAAVQENGMHEVTNPNNSNFINNSNIKTVIKGTGTEEIPIPEGATYKEGTESTGIVIEYKGSEFVWIPIPTNNRTCP